MFRSLNKGRYIVEAIGALGCIAVESEKSLAAEVEVEVNSMGIRITRPKDSGPPSGIRIANRAILEEFGDFGIGRNRNIRHYKVDENTKTTKKGEKVITWMARKTEKYPFGADKDTMREFEARKAELRSYLAAYKLAENDFTLYVFFYNIFAFSWCAFRTKHKNRWFHSIPSCLFFF